MSKQLTQHHLDRYQQLVTEFIKKAKDKGASQVEIAVGVNHGLDINVRCLDVETLEHVNHQGLGMTVYYGQRKGHASTSDLTPHALEQTLEKACNIAKFTQEDEYAGLADQALMAMDYPTLDLYHPWRIEPDKAIEMAIECEKLAMDADSRISNSEGVQLSATEALSVYGNSHGFLGHYFVSQASMSCSLIAGMHDNMQRSYDYTLAIDPMDLWSVQRLAASTAQRTIARLGARKIKTCQVPVIFSTDVAAGFLGHAIAAISGSSQYRRSSFLLDSLHQQIFPTHITMEEDPFIPKGLSSVPFDSEGVRVKPRRLVDAGVLQGYLLSSYSARKLGMQSTGNAGGMHNLLVSHSNKSFKDLLKTMDTGLLVTEMMGQGINMVTGDYSRGASGFWVEKGEIQYPVEEITIAGNLKDLYQHIVAIGNDVDTRHTIQTGSILVENMSIAGE